MKALLIFLFLSISFPTLAQEVYDWGDWNTKDFMRTVGKNGINNFVGIVDKNALIINELDNSSLLIKERNDADSSKKPLENYSSTSKNDINDILNLGIGTIPSLQSMGYPGQMP